MFLFWSPFTISRIRCKVTKNVFCRIMGHQQFLKSRFSYPFGQFKLSALLFESRKLQQISLVPEGFQTRQGFRKHLKLGPCPPNPDAAIDQENSALSDYFRKNKVTHQRTIYMKTTFMWSYKHLQSVGPLWKSTFFRNIAPLLPPFQCWLLRRIVLFLDLREKTLFAIHSTLKRGEGGQKFDFFSRGPTLL